MSKRAEREAARLTVSWLDEAGVKEWQLQAKQQCLTVMPSAPSPAVSTRSVVQEKRDALLSWAGDHHFPHMILHLSTRLYVIHQGGASWHGVCRGGEIEIIEAALEQSRDFRPVVEESYRSALVCLGRARSWERFAFKPSSVQGTLYIGDGTEGTWMRFVRCGLFAQVVEACELLEKDWDQRLLCWAEEHDWPHFTYCQADGETGVIESGEESWRSYLDKTYDQLRIQMVMEVLDQEEIEAGRGE